jgi:saccharopine dehydrogenase-like NADP-dependent oxidoreductase
MCVQGAQTFSKMMQQVVALLILAPTVCLSLSSSGFDPGTNTFVILGGAGRIGTAVASHLLHIAPESKIVLVGRNQARGDDAVKEVLSEQTQQALGSSVTFALVEDCWQAESLKPIVEGADCLIHTAGPYLGKKPTPLEVAIASASCKAYVDVSDPLNCLEVSLDLTDKAKKFGTSALLASGAFPGMSNVLAVEAASKTTSSTIKDVRFNYFTAGLGGSGDVNLYITNLGF